MPEDLASFALEAPAIYKAVADEEIWQKYFKRKKIQMRVG